MADTKSHDHEDAARRGVLAHAEHVRSLGEAFLSAANAYTTGHESSEQDKGWQEDLHKNLSEASRELHRVVFAAPQRIYDTYLAEDEDRKGPSDKPAGGQRKQAAKKGSE